MTNYVLGFAFKEDRSEVALIRKNRPAWQKGKLNGIGGKVKDGELEHVAMIREFKEETSEEIEDWRLFARLSGVDFVVHCYVAFSNKVKYCQSETDEEVFLLDTNTIIRAAAKENSGLIPNVGWLIGMALDKDQIFADIFYPMNEKEEADSVA